MGNSRPTAGRRGVRQVQRAQRVQHQSDPAEQDRCNQRWRTYTSNDTAAEHGRRRSRGRRSCRCGRGRWPITNDRSSSHVQPIPSSPPSPPVLIATVRHGRLSTTPTPTRPISPPAHPTSPTVPQPSLSTAPTPSPVFVTAIQFIHRSRWPHVLFITTDSHAENRFRSSVVHTTATTAIGTVAPATATSTTLLAEPTRRHGYTGRSRRCSATAPTPSSTLAPVALAPPAPVPTPGQQSLRRGWRFWRKRRRW